MINFTKDILITKHYCVDIDEFVDNHLVDIKLYKSTGEYDFYIHAGRKDVFLQRVFSIEASKLEGVDIDNPASIKERLREHFKKGYSIC